MATAEAQRIELGRPNLFWWATLAYAGIAMLGWLVLGIARLLYWRSTQRNIDLALAQGDLVLAEQGRLFAGTLFVDMVFAFGTALVFAYGLVALTRRTWNGWDHATLAIGFLTVLSLIMLCASGRLMRFMPLSAAPLLALLYLPGTKVACEVRPAPLADSSADAPIGTLSRQEIEQEISKERALITQLSQNLDVFEVERGIETDRFVARYSDGLEEESADNAEWFSIARAVRRSQDRLAALRTQLDAVPHE